jgi:hypothetical protein
VADDQLAAVLPEDVGVGDDLDPPAAIGVAHAVVLGDVEAEMLLTAQADWIAVSQRETMRDGGGVVAADDHMRVRNARQQPHRSTA